METHFSSLARVSWQPILPRGARRSFGARKSVGALRPRETPFSRGAVGAIATRGSLSSRLSSGAPGSPLTAWTRGAPLSPRP